MQAKLEETAKNILQYTERL